MLHLRSLVAALALCAPSAFAQLSVAQARGDLDVLQRALDEAHGALHRFTSKGALDRTFDDARARITAPIDQRAFIPIVSQAIAAVRDGHLRLEYDSATTAALGSARRFPLRVALEGDRLVALDTSADQKIVPGMAIVRINGQPASAVIARILPNLPGDGFVETGKRMRLARTFNQQYWLFVDPTDRFAIEARDTRGLTVATTLLGITDAERPRAPDAGPNVTLRFDGSVGVLRIRGFDGAGYPAALDSVFDLVRARGTPSMILDLRGNGGGVDMYGASLVAHFASAPFRYFDHIHLTTIRPSFATWKPSTFDDVRNGTVPDPAGGFRVTRAMHEGIAEQSPAPNAFRGTLVVLIDGGTFSTAADVTAMLRSQHRATFVGEETGGTYEGNTSGLNALVVLPASGLKLKVQMYGYVNAVRPMPKGRGTLPDVAIAARVADQLRGVDAAMDRAVTLARGGR